MFSGFLLTRCLLVMTRIVEQFDGILVEVLGDGLLVLCDNLMMWSTIGSGMHCS